MRNRFMAVCTLMAAAAMVFVSCKDAEDPSRKEQLTKPPAQPPSTTSPAWCMSR